MRQPHKTFLIWFSVVILFFISGASTGAHVQNPVEKVTFENPGVSLDQTSQNDANSGMDAREDNAIPISMNSNYTGTMGSNYDGDGVDAYSLDTTGVTVGYLHTVVSVLEPGLDITVGIGDLGITRGHEFDYSVPIAHSEPENIVFGISSCSSGAGGCSPPEDPVVTYTFSFYFIEAQLPYQNDAGMGTDAPDDFGNPQMVNFGVEYSGVVGDPWINSEGYFDGTDVYAFEITETENITVQVAIKINSSEKWNYYYWGVGLLEEYVYDSEIFHVHSTINDPTPYSETVILEPGIYYIMFLGYETDSHIYWNEMSPRFTDVQYNFTITKSGVSDANPFGQLTNPLFVVLLAFTGLAFLGYFKKEQIRSYFWSPSNNNGYSSSRRINQILSDSFGKRSLLILGQSANKSKNKKPIKTKLQDNVPPELYDEKFMLHPVRLALLKVLSMNFKLTSSDLRSRLDLSWSDYSTHIKTLAEKDYVEVSEQLVDSRFIQVVMVTSIGIEKYNYVANLLTEFLELSENDDDLYPSSI